TPRAPLLAARVDLAGLIRAGGPSGVEDLVQPRREGLRLARHPELRAEEAAVVAGELHRPPAERPRGPFGSTAGETALRLHPYRDDDAGRCRRDGLEVRPEGGDGGRALQE